MKPWPHISTRCPKVTREPLRESKSGSSVSSSPPEEAALAVEGHLEARAARSHLPPEPHSIPQEAAQRLYDMSRKGLIYRLRKGEQVYYLAAQFIIGIWEFHVNDLDPELIRDRE